MATKADLKNSGKDVRMDRTWTGERKRKATPDEVALSMDGRGERI